ncbi:30S ribosomal protein S13 [Sulfodiicoccus acidiphilus]|nr:30S ribosomal protein S13 [Sulfodiicoccus acidiphilus]
MSSGQEFKYIVRLFGQDTDGRYKAAYALAMVKGIGYNTAKGILLKAGLDPNKRLGNFTDAEIKKVVALVSSKRIEGLPVWMYNRRSDYESGTDLHLVTSDLLFYAREDIEREKKVKSWRGIRHSLGLKVRGQRTRTTGRTGGTVGVRRSKQGQQQQQQSK